jgi:hypothetical protein
VRLVHVVQYYEINKKKKKKFRFYRIDRKECKFGSKLNFNLMILKLHLL